MASLMRWTTPLIWALLFAALAASALFAAGAFTVLQINSAIRARNVEELKPLPTDFVARYAAAWDLERAQHFDQAIALFTEVRAATDPALAADAWFAVGNVYFESGIKASRNSMDEGPGESAEFDLARDAYRAALRIDPELHGARYNLELLERLAPARPGEGWRRNTDPISIQPDRHNGWTTIQESAKRGLP
jgi:tetratricopeptide (TPR) repeat protein